MLSVEGNIAPADPQPESTAMAKPTLHCPLCGDDEANLSMSLTDGQHTCECGSCGEEFTLSQAVEMLQARMELWLAVATWADESPLVARPRAVRKTA